MAFRVSDYYDLLQLLEQHPEWRSDLRRLLLTDEILALPEIVKQLAEAQQRTEKRVAELAAAQERTEKRLEDLTTTVNQLAAAQERTEKRVDELTTIMQRMYEDVGRLKGLAMEAEYRSHAYGYFGSWLSRARAVDMSDLEEIENALQSRQLSAKEFKALSDTDVFVRGRIPLNGHSQEILVALEVSWVIDPHDVERAAARAALLRKIGYQAVGAVGGDGYVGEVKERANEMGVVVMVRGTLESAPPTPLRVLE